MNKKRLLAIDPSLTCSGWALFDVRSSDLLGIGELPGPGPDQGELAERLAQLQRDITALFKKLRLGELDVLVCEAPTTMRDPHAALKVEQVRCCFEAVARELGATVPGRLNPRSVQNEVIGLSGKQLTRAIVKDSAVRVVMATHGAALKDCGFVVSERELAKHQDVVDAVLLGSLALTRLVDAARTKGSIYEAFAAVRSTGRGRRVTR